MPAILMSTSVRFAAAFLLLFASAFVTAEVTLPKVLSDNMVLQRDTPVAIWGTASPGEAVRVGFAGKQASTAADATGGWLIRLGPFTASAQPRVLQITATNTVTLHNILVGEVWLCSGQSNMEYAMGSNNERIILRVAGAAGARDGHPAHRHGGHDGSC